MGYFDAINTRERSKFVSENWTQRKKKVIASSLKVSFHKNDVVRVQFRKKSLIIFKWAVFSVPAETTLFQLLDQIHSGMFLIFFFLVCILYYFVVFQWSM